METSVISKAEIRKRVLARRKELQPEECGKWDERILSRIKSAVQPCEGAVFCYISVRGETGTKALIDWYLTHGIRVAVPRVSGREMAFYFIRGREDLEPGRFGIPEPRAGCEPADCKRAPVLVPGVGFSKEGSRVGYGAGYYDRFFAAEPEHEKIGICYDFQLFDRVETEAHDRGMDRIITPENAYSFGRNS